MNNVDVIKERDELVAALKQIAAIVNQTSGGDWDEIEMAREIARAILSKYGYLNFETEETYNIEPNRDI